MEPIAPNHHPQAAEAQVQKYAELAKVDDAIWAAPTHQAILKCVDRALAQYSPWTGASVLDLACGSALALQKARALGATYCVGVDISAEMLEVARANTLKAS